MANYNGTSGNDNYTGTGSDDTIKGLDGNDTLRGSGGNDFINGNADNDRVYGDAGNDEVRGGSGDDYVYGDGGDDEVYGNIGNDRVYGGSGNDNLYGNENNDTLYGGSGNDFLQGNSGNDVVYGEDGNDDIHGGSGSDQLEGGTGNDTLDGDGGTDTAIFSGNVEDYTITQSGSDFIVTHDSGSNGSDLVRDIEILQFADDTLTWDGSNWVSTSNTAPTASDDSATTNQDTAVNITVLANDSDAEDTLDASNLSISGNASNGSVTIETDGTITYTPNAGFSGQDTFEYTVTDSGSATDTATVTVDVTAPSNTAPTAQDDSATTDEDTAVNIDVLANDSDPEDSSLGASNLSISSNAANGSVTIETDGTITYTPDAGFSGSDSFDYTLTDSGSATDTATVDITVNSNNIAPTAQDDQIESNQYIMNVSIDVLANDSDSDGTLDTSSVTITSDPANGTAVAQTDGTVLYSPAAGGWTGIETFTYSVADNEGATSSATVEVEVKELGQSINGSGNPDVITGGGGDDTLYGNAGHDTIYGSGGDDIIDGGKNNDRLYGGFGADTITGGGGGSDHYIYTDLGESTNAELDIITDFNPGNERLDLSALGFNGINDFTITNTGGNTLVEDNGSTFAFELTGTYTLTAGDFIF